MLAAEAIIVAPSSTHIIRPRVVLTQKVELFPYDSVLGKRVLTYQENRGNPAYSHMNVFIVPTENYTFLKGSDLPLFKNT